MKPDLQRANEKALTQAVLSPAVRIDSIADGRCDSREQPTGRPHTRPRSAEAQMRDDEALSQRVRLFLASSNIPALKHLIVEVDGDTVLLLGGVHTFYEKQLAAEFSRRVAGVIRVDNKIDVRGYAPRDHVSRADVPRVNVGPSEDVRQTGFEHFAPG